MSVRHVLFWCGIVVISIFLQGIVTTLPVILCILLLGYITKKEAWFFVVGFFCGILLDVLQVRPIGQSSLFFVLLLTLVFLYERKFEIATVPFVMLSSFFASYLFLQLFSSSFVLLQALLSCMLCVFVFLFASKFSSQASEY